MYWRREGISVLPYLDGFMAMKQGFGACVRLARRLESDFVRAGLMINVPKCHRILAQQRRQLGFDADFTVGNFQVPSDRSDAIKVSVDSILAARHGRVHPRRLASVTGTVLSMYLSWGPLTPLYAMHSHALIILVVSLNPWVGMTEEVVNDLTFWQYLPRLRFEGAIWPPTEGVAIRVASDFIDFGCEGKKQVRCPGARPRVFFKDGVR